MFHSQRIRFGLGFLGALSFLGTAGTGLAQGRGGTAAPDESVSPQRRIERAAPEKSQERAAGGHQSIDGRGNNPTDPTANQAHTPLARILTSDYGDGISTLAGADRPSARVVSNAMAAQHDDLPNEYGASDYLWQWGQFVDHDIDLSDGTDPPEAANIPVPAGDEWFDPDSDGDVSIPFNRTIYDADSAPRQQINEISGWIDGSMVYGSDGERAEALRTNDGTGRLRTTPSLYGDLLPYNEGGFPNAGGSGDTLFLAGDVRANEQVGLTAMHTLFVREHNRRAGQIARKHPGLDGDRVYQRARRHVIGLIQSITYNEFLPALLGPRALPRYRGYRKAVDARIANHFSTAAYRFGHSALSPQLLRLDASLEEIADGHLPLRDAFFAPQRIAEEGGIDPILRGLAWQACQSVDPYVIDDVRNFLFGPPGAGGFDLAALNIQRGRDHGLPSYNAAREAFGLPPASGFGEVNSDPEVQASLASVYANVDAIDLWVGGLAEPGLPGSHAGPLFHRMLVEQFVALRDGDRFWYQKVMPFGPRSRIERTTLADVIRRNTEIGDEIPDSVFQVE